MLDEIDQTKSSPRYLKICQCCYAYYEIDQTSSFFIMIIHPLKEHYKVQILHPGIKVFCKLTAEFPINGTSFIDYTEALRVARYNPAHAIDDDESFDEYTLNSDTTASEYEEDFEDVPFVAKVLPYADDPTTSNFDKNFVIVDQNRVFLDFVKKKRKKLD